MMQLRARRRASLLGWLWLVLPTLATLLIALLLQRQRIVPLPQTELPFAAFVTIGVATWQTAMEALNLPLRQLAAQRFAITRLGMPVEAPIVAGLMDLAAHALIRIALLLLLLPFLGVAPGASIVGLPVLLAGLIALPLAIGMVAAPVGLLVEDVGRGLLIIAGLWMIATPVFYPVAGPLMTWNPAAILLESVRSCLTGEVAAAAAWPVAAACVLLLVPAWAWLRLGRRYLIDRIA